MKLEWTDVDDVLGVPGWGLRVGYTYYTEPGDAPVVTIHRIEINTGQRVLEMQINEFPNLSDLESVVSEMVETDQHEAAYELSHPERKEFLG